MAPSVAVIIPAAGFGTRMNLDHPKQYHLLAGMPMLVRTVKAFIGTDAVPIDGIVVAVPEDRIEQTKMLFNQYGLRSYKLNVIAGGRRRQDSVRAGLAALDPGTDIVLVHDGARPLVTPEIIARCYAAVLQDGAAIVAIPVKDTLKKAGGDGRVAATVDRGALWQAQTPQGARKELLERAYLVNGEADVTDESSLLETAGIPVTIIEGSETNMKITHPEDLALAENIIRQKSVPNIRIGHGYDAHRFADNRKLVLGGVTIPHNQGLAGHSDADVLTHALCDALLGALGAGDIGKHFPDTDKKFAGIYSIDLLAEVVGFAAAGGFTLANADITVVCQAPRLAPYLTEMKAILGSTCKVAPEVINIKATTTEGMGFTGRKEGIGCHAVVLLQAR
ncbi:MAG: bifunctional 2-C-methyl-D-erythritol 4-phosphate cytidylyltransferase/2-C-methyl-D-erythritol 2,4-cyclodiphosphate synthase [Desulfobacterales bacterium GWB2_56_26]|nr:MAG: bifunctional 2-C-methyl-D-erythritol 4-phosphate cytidylyltransferase/2-C-methyl-D-erythritol 2,4-cyclodiphosphate synthase [Desulfobacterales bacterium GWB2_56_26]